MKSPSARLLELIRGVWRARCKTVDEGESAADGNRALPGDEIALNRRYLHDQVMLRAAACEGLCPPFEGLSWEYFFADVELEARAARIRIRDGSVGVICDTILALPSPAIVRLMAARHAYFSPPADEAWVDELLRPVDAVRAKLMRQRRHAVHAAQAIEAKREEARREAVAAEDALRAQWYVCPHAKLSSEPEDLLRWVKVQTPDTWHIIVEGCDYNYDDRDDVIEWIFDQPNCDLGTAAQFFFTAGLADEDPEKLSRVYRRKWHLMKRIADNWRRGFYVRNELQHSVEPSEMKGYDELVVRREAAGRPLPWKVPGPTERRFGSRQPDSMYCYEHGHLKLAFSAWKRHRSRSGCGKDYPRCCQA